MFSLAELSNFRLLNLHRSPAKWIFSRGLEWIGWTVLFAVIYAQSPLYTSNQNQYFLHGLANANYGYLNNDWLANTLDPTPLFSLLVSLTYRIFRTDVLFYGYYAILMGIYLFALLGTGSILFNLNHPAARIVYLATLMVLNSAGMRFFLSRSFGPEWGYLLEGGLAGQRVLGVVFQPSTLGVLLILSIFLFLKGHSYLAIIPLGLAVSFHPTYLLSAGMLTLAFVVESFRETRNLAKILLMGILALLVVSPTLFYVYLAFGSTPPETTAQARDILVYFRIPHHAVASEWFDITSVFQIAFLLAAAYLVRRTRLFTILVIPFLLALLLSLVQIARQDEGLALLFPWRISSILVPISVATVAAFLVKKSMERFSVQMEDQNSRLILASLIVILIASLIGATRTILERQMIRGGEEGEMMRYVEAEKTPGDVYLIPTKLQEFRLETGAPVYVDFKSIPYQDAEVLEWYRRIQLASKFYEKSKFDCDLVDDFADEGVTHIVINLDESGDLCQSTKIEYLDEHYGVYSIVR